MFELSAATARAYLKSRGLNCSEARIQELGGGVSNIVLLVEAGEQRLVLKQALGKLRVEQDWFSGRKRILREATGMKELAPVLPAGAIPQVLFLDEDNYIFAMTAAPPEAQTWKAQLLSGTLRIEIAGQIGRMLGLIVRSTWRDAGWERVFGDQTFFDELRLDPYYRTTALRHPGLKSYFDKLIEQCQSQKLSVVHGDWSPKNFLVTAGQAMAIDFEVIHFGDPSFDSGFLLNHLLLKSFYREQWRGGFRQLAKRFWETYRESLPVDAGWMEAATLRHLGGLLLARLDGKSPVEYLTEPGLRDRVRKHAIELIVNPPHTVLEAF